MPLTSNRWALVLAAGSGTRLSTLTADATGAAVPKQFCSLNGGPSLLDEALARAAAVAPREQTLVVVAAEHRQYWRSALAHLDAANVIVQPRNRGTANGILLGVTAILARAPDALVAILPSDHYVAREAVLAAALERALRHTHADERSIGFLGLTPEFADPELGYIVRGAPRGDGSCAVARFVEKPSRAEAAALLRRRALWNSFIIVARAAALAELVARRFPAEAAAFGAAWRASEPEAALARLYEQLPELDFSHGVVEGADAPLHVVPVPSCGWSDLGTPRRVAECLARLGAATAPAVPASSHVLNLAEAYARLSRATPAAQSA